MNLALNEHSHNIVHVIIESRLWQKFENNIA